MKDLYETNKTRNEKIVNRVSDALFISRNLVNRNETPENEQPDKKYWESV